MFGNIGYCGTKRFVSPYLTAAYGEKLKVYLISGARQLNAAKEYPNPMFGYGALCLRDSLRFSGN